LGALVAGLVVALATGGGQAEAAPVTLAAVRVDTGPIAARGLPNYARRVAVLAQPAAQAVFQPQTGGGRDAPTLVLRLSLVQLTS
ncbi:hypothetical protein J8J27_31545, partial [Mycobacterium tuberculosis]|nr:hypothetical protein [Mycobacterium tuberculosis]